MKSPDCNPRWARSPWTTNCCPPRSPPWRPKTLWPEGGRDDEPDGLAFHVSLLWPGAGLARVECFARRRVSLSQANAIACDRPSPRSAIETSDFHGEGYRKIWARLRVAGVRSSPRRVRRVMGENGLLAPHRVGRNQEKTHDGTIVTDKVNEMWGTDMSQTVTLEEGRAYVFVAVEHANSEI